MQNDLLSSLLSHRLWAQVPFEVRLALSFGNPLQYSCLENPRDGGAWWAAVHGVAQSQTRLSDLAAAAADLKCLSPSVSSARVTVDWAVLPHGPRLSQKTSRASPDVSTWTNFKV